MRIPAYTAHQRSDDLLSLLRPTPAATKARLDELKMSTESVGDEDWMKLARFSQSGEAVLYSDRELLERAGCNDTKALIELAERSLRKRDGEEAVLAYLRRARDLGDPDADFESFRILHAFQHRSSDNKRRSMPAYTAAERASLERIAAKGSARAHGMLAQSYYFGSDGFPADVERSKMHLVNQVALGDPAAKSTLAFCYEHAAYGLPRDYAKAASLYRELADEGLPTAEYGAQRAQYLASSTLATLFNRLRDRL